MVPARLQVNLQILERTPRARTPQHHDSDPIQSKHPTSVGDTGGHVGNHAAAGLDASSTTPASGASHPGMGIAAVESGANTAGNGGDGYFYGSIIHASLLIYQPINISVSLGYGSVALANQSNNLNVDQSAFQMAGVGGHGGNDNIASGGSVSTSLGAGVIASGDNGAGNGGSGYFSGAIVDAPVVIYHPRSILRWRPRAALRMQVNRTRWISINRPLRSRASAEVAEMAIWPPAAAS
ncbi:hypothetical protein ACVWZR_006451 [Bradyrhizobium sp. i1.3.1]